MQEDNFPKHAFISNFEFIRNHNLTESFHERTYQFNAKHAMNI